MKRHGLLFLALTGALLTSCGGPADGTPPTASVTANPNPLIAPGTVTFTAQASDASGVNQVMFYDNGTLIGTDGTSPYQATKAYTFANNGDHAITIKVVDNKGNIGQAATTLKVAIADAFEPNDSVAAAAPLAIGGTANGVITAQGRDMDYFKFDAAAGDMLKLTVKSVSVDAKSTLDPYVMILMPDGKTILEKDDDTGAGLESEIRFNAPVAGTYTAVVTSYKISEDPNNTDDLVTNTYQLSLTRR